MKVVSIARLYATIVFFAVAPAQAQNSPLSQSQPIVELTPLIGDFNSIAETRFSISDRSMLVGSSWTSKIYEFQLTVDGQWQQVAIIEPDSDSSQDADANIGFGYAVTHSRDTAAVLGGYGYRPDTLTILSRNSSGDWNTDNTFNTPGAKSVAIDSSGNQILLLRNRYSFNEEEQEEDRYFYGTYAQIYAPEGQWQLTTEILLAEEYLDYNSAICINNDIAVAGKYVLRKSTAGVWSLSHQLPFNATHLSDDCRIARAYDFGNKQWQVQQLDENGIWTESDTPPFSQYNNQYAINQIRSYDITPHIEVYKVNSNGDYTQSGVIEIGEHYRFGQYNVELIDSLLVVSTLSPAIVTIYDLSKMSLQPAVANNTEECKLGYSDPDGDGYGWENDAVCVMPEDYITLNDSRQSLYIDVDQSYPQLPGQPVAVHNTLAILPDRDESSQTVNLAIYEQDNLSWRQTTTLPLTADYQRIVNDEYTTAQEHDQYSGPLGKLSVDTDGTAIVVGLPNASVQDTNYGMTLLYERDAQDQWVFKGSLTRPENVNLFALFGNAVALSNDLIVVSNNIWGGYGTSPAGLHTYKRTASGNWELLNQLWDTRRPGASPRFGLSLALNGTTLMATNGNHEAGNYDVEVFELNSNDIWQHKQLLPKYRHWGHFPTIDLKQNTAAVVEGGNLRLFTKGDNNQWAADAVLTGGQMFVDAGTLWTTNKPIDVEDRSYYQPLEWPNNQEYFPVAYGSTEQTQTDELQSTPDESTPITDNQNADNSLSSEISSESNNDNGGSGTFSNVNLIMLILAAGFFRRLRACLK